MHGYRISRKRCALAQIRLRVRVIRRADIAALDVQDHEQSGFACAGNQSLQRADAAPAMPLVEGGLRLNQANRGDLLRKLGREAEARAEFERAAALTSNERERELSAQRARQGMPGS